MERMTKTLLEKSLNTVLDKTSQRKFEEEVSLAVDQGQAVVRSTSLDPEEEAICH